jgi:hypothetical protein
LIASRSSIAFPKHAVGFQELKNRVRGCVGRELLRVDVQLRIARRFVRIVDAGEVFDLPGPRFLIESLRIARLSGSERNIDMHFDELAVGEQRAHSIAIGAIRADKRGHDDRAGGGKQFGEFADATNVLRTIFSAESEVLVQSVSDIVAVEPVDELAAFVQFLLEDCGDR